MVFIMIRKLELAGVIVLLILIGIFLYEYTKTPIIGGPVYNEKLVDGIYEGRYNRGPIKAVVLVTIKDRKIVNIEIVKYISLKRKRVTLIILERIIENQSTNVDAVSGATKSSRVIMNAVQKAIENAYFESLEMKY